MPKKVKKEEEKEEEKEVEKEEEKVDHRVSVTTDSGEDFQHLEIIDLFILIYE